MDPVQIFCSKQSITALDTARQLRSMAAFRIEMQFLGVPDGTAAPI